MSELKETKAAVGGAASQHPLTSEVEVTLNNIAINTES